MKERYMLGALKQLLAKIFKLFGRKQPLEPVIDSTADKVIAAVDKVEKVVDEAVATEKVLAPVIGTISPVARKVADAVVAAEPVVDAATSSVKSLAQAVKDAPDAVA
jgi:dihydroxyacetone kinase-like predicted kinase